MTPPIPHPHQEIINGLTHLADYLILHPDLPAPSDVEVRWLMGGEDSQRVASVREVARLWETTPVWEEPAGQVYVCWRFPGITFAALAQLQEAAAAPTQEPPPADVDQTALLPLLEAPCADCRGTGRQRDGSPCADCLGKGRVAAWSPQAEVGW